MIIVINKESQAEPGMSISIIGEESIVQFQKLISRGANTWDQAPPAIKDAVDKIIHGKITQNYHVQGTKSRPE